MAIPGGTYVTEIWSGGIRIVKFAKFERTSRASTVRPIWHWYIPSSSRLTLTICRLFIPKKNH